MATLRFPLALAALTLALPAFAQAPSQSPDQTKPTPPAQSQSVAPSPSTSAPSTGSFMTEMKPGMWRAAKLNGVNVYNAQNEKIGDINDVLIDQQGKVQGVVIGVGGFLGMGEHDVAVPFEQIKFSDEPMRTASSSSSSSSSSTTSGANRNVDRADVTGTTPSSSASSSANRKGYPDHALLNLTKEQLKAAPQFHYPSSTGR